MSTEHTVIRASAGAGKTWRLGNRYLGLLAAGVAPENIVAATFSRKAAGEILERILTRLAAASLSAEAGARLAVDLGAPGFTAETAGALLRTLARSLHRLRVCTLDSLFGDVARGFGPELGLPPGWEMAEEDDHHRLQVEAIDAALRGYDLDALLQMLNDLDDGAASQSVIQGFDEVIKAFHAVACESDAATWGAVVAEGRLDGPALDAEAAVLRADPVTNGHIKTAREKVLVALAQQEWAVVGGSKHLPGGRGDVPAGQVRPGGAGGVRPDSRPRARGDGGGAGAAHDQRAADARPLRGAVPGGAVAPQAAALRGRRPRHRRRGARLAAGGGVSAPRCAHRAHAAG